MVIAYVVIKTDSFDLPHFGDRAKCHRGAAIPKSD